MNKLFVGLGLIVSMLITDVMLGSWDQYRSTPNATSQIFRRLYPNSVVGHNLMPHISADKDYPIPSFLVTSYLVHSTRQSNIFLGRRLFRTFEEAMDYIDQY